MGKDSAPINCELEETLTYMLENQYTEYYRNKEEFQWAERDLITYINKANYWQKMKLFSPMLSFLTIVFAILYIFATEGSPM